MSVIKTVGDLAKHKQWGIYIALIIVIIVLVVLGYKKDSNHIAHSTEATLKQVETNGKIESAIATQTEVNRQVISAVESLTATTQALKEEIIRNND